MSDLDQELKEALAESEAEAPAAESDAAQDAPAVAVASEQDQPKRNLGLLAAMVVAGAAVLGLVFTSVDDAAIYSVTTDKLLEDVAKYEGKSVRVEGDLVQGSLRHRKEPCEYRFDIEKNGAKLAVRYPQCIVPDTFKDVPGIDVQVTAEGSLKGGSDGGAQYFEASLIMAKCPSKYEMQERAAKGEAAPHEMSGAQEIPEIVDEPKK